jgi:hypothetical protein
MFAMPVQHPGNAHQFRVQELVYSARNWTPMDENATLLTRQYMAGNATLFANTHRKMFEMAQAGSKAPQYTTRYLTLTSFEVPATGIEGKYR